MQPRVTHPFVLPIPITRNWLPLWGRWVVANALGELVGLGFIALAAGALIWQFGAPHSVASVLLFTTMIILLGACEGCVLGWAQWMAMRPYIRSLKRRSWEQATIVGAVIAWGLGMIPSTLFSLQETTAAVSPPMQIDDTMKYFMAAGMGLVLGLILGVPQWMVLRRYANRAGWWVGANAVAWMVGMPIVFFGAGAVPERTSGWLLVLMIALTLLIAGAVVGEIHGCALVWFLHNRRSQKDSLI